MLLSQYIPNKTFLKPIEKRPIYIDGELTYQYFQPAEVCQEVRQKMSASHKAHWQWRFDNGFRTAKLYRRFLKKKAKQNLLTPKLPNDEAILKDPRVARYLAQLKSVPDNSYTLRINKANLPDKIKNRFRIPLPTKTVYLSDRGRFYSFWTSMSNVDEYSTRNKIFAGDLDIDMKHAHFSILLMLLKRYSSLGQMVEEHLKGQDIYDYFGAAGLPKSKAKKLINPIIYGAQRKKISEIKKEAGCTSKTPPLVDCIRQARKRMMYENRVPFDALGRPVAFKDPYDPDNYLFNKRQFVDLIYSYELIMKCHLFTDLPGATILGDYHDGVIVSIRDKRRLGKVKSELDKRRAECKTLFDVDLDLKYTGIGWDCTLIST